jgi:hypothetical protein
MPARHLGATFKSAGFLSLQLLHQCSTPQTGGAASVGTQNVRVVKLRMSGSHWTPRWSKADSNFESRFQKKRRSDTHHSIRTGAPWPTGVAPTPRGTRGSNPFPSSAESCANRCFSKLWRSSHASFFDGSRSNATDALKSGL